MYDKFTFTFPSRHFADALVHTYFALLYDDKLYVNVLYKQKVQTRSSARRSASKGLRDIRDFMKTSKKKENKDSNQ